MKIVAKIILKLWAQNIPSSVKVGSFLLRNPRVKMELATPIFAVVLDRCRKSQINEMSYLFHSIN
jgi:hypothetical protein